MSNFLPTVKAMVGPKSSGDWSPLSLAGIYQWFDAQDFSSITKDGAENITQWNDKSGNSAHLTATGTTGPVYESTGMNSKPGVTFSASKGLANDTAFGLDYLAGQQDITIMMVMQLVDEATTSRSYMYWERGVSSYTRLAVRTRLRRFEFGVRQQPDNNVWTDYTSSGSQYLIPQATPVIFRWDGALSTRLPKTYLSSSGDTTDIEFADPLPDTDPFDAAPSFASSIGGAALQGGNGAEYKMGELILVRGLMTLQEIIDVNVYLKARWGIA